MQTSAENRKTILILAGPNGAGKTTFAREYLVNEAAVPEFVNADLIAAGLSPVAPERAAARAGRLMLERMDELAACGESFAFETTLAGRVYARRIAQWRRMGYHVTLIYLALDSADTAVSRVAERVRQGGHAVPEETIRRRYESGRRNFDAQYSRLVDAWALYDNTGRRPVLLDWWERP